MTVNFKDENTLRTLTKCLLHRDFELDVILPPDKLVPTLPLRLNYILWIEDILKVAGITSNVTGIDIGIPIDIHSTCQHLNRKMYSHRMWSVLHLCFTGSQGESMENDSIGGEQR